MHALDSKEDTENWWLRRCLGAGLGFSRDIKMTNAMNTKNVEQHRLRSTT